MASYPGKILLSIRDHPRYRSVKCYNFSHLMSSTLSKLGGWISQINNERILRLPAQNHIALLVMCFANVAIPDFGQNKYKKKNNTE